MLIAPLITSFCPCETFQNRQLEKLQLFGKYLLATADKEEQRQQEINEATTPAQELYECWWEGLIH